MSDAERIKEENSLTDAQRQVLFDAVNKLVAVERDLGLVIKGLEALPHKIPRVANSLHALKDCARKDVESSLVLLRSLSTEEYTLKHN